MAWRLARSLQVLADEIQQVAPGTTVWDIGDEDHQQRASDHNPNDAEVVCAIDVIDDAGLDLAHLAETVRTGGHPAGKYVIYEDRIARWWNGWTWDHYGGTFHSHVHVSVGRGPDGASTGPYDDTSPWGLASSTGGIMALPRMGDEGEHVEVVQRMLVGLGYDIGKDDNGDWLYDGIYGPGTESAVAAFRADVGPNVTPSVEHVTPWTFYRLIRAVGALDGGEQGPPGPPGPAGEDGKTPTTVKLQLTADVTETE